jgi:hypothetical protein
MSFENCIGEVIKLLTTRAAFIALAFRLVGVKTPFANFGGITRWALDARGPTQLADGCKTFGIVNQGLKIDHRSTSAQNRDADYFSTFVGRSRTSLESELSEMQMPSLADLITQQAVQRQLGASWQPQAAPPTY